MSEGVASGRFKDDMNKMFDTRGRSSMKQAEHFAKTIEQKKRVFGQTLYTDWLLQAYTKCSTKCLKVAENAVQPASITK